jgi:hypothetical protein
MLKSLILSLFSISNKTQLSTNLVVILIKL